MAERQVIQEFLSRLGFQIDAPSFRNFISMIKRACVSAATLGASIAGVVVALEALVLRFARGMEQLYYSSIRTRSSVANIKAMEFALGQIGVEASQARALLEHLGSQLRVNPATEGLLKMLGVETEGKDRVEVVMDLLKKLKTQFSGNQYLVGASFAERLLGIDEPTYYQLTSRLDELEKGIEEHNQRLRRSKIDAEAAAKASREYMNELRQLGTELGLLGDRLAIDLLPVFREINGMIKSIVQTLQTLDFTNLEKSGDLMRSRWGIVGDIIYGVLQWVRAIFAMMGFVRDTVASLVTMVFGPKESKLATAAVYNTAAGKIRGAEGSGGPETTTRPTEAGPFPVESAAGRAAAARRALLLLQAEQRADPNQPGIDREVAAAEALVRRLGADVAPIPAGVQASPTTGLGTRNVSGGITATFTSEVNVYGSSDPRRAAEEVGRVQTRVYGDAVRNLGANLR